VPLAVLSSNYYLLHLFLSSLVVTVLDMLLVLFLAIKIVSRQMMDVSQSETPTWGSKTRSTLDKSRDSIAKVACLPYCILVKVKNKDLTCHNRDYALQNCKYNNDKFELFHKSNSLSI